MLSKAWEGFLTIKETDNFALVYDPNRNPREPGTNFYIVYKPLSTVEVDAEGVAMGLHFLTQAEENMKAFNSETSLEQGSARLN